MKLVINGIEYEVPFDPNLIQLGDYIEYYETYGKSLDQKLIGIFGNEELDEESKLIKLDNLVDEEALSWFSFWTKLDLLKAKGLPDVEPLLSAYRNFRYLLKSAEEECSLPFRTQWNGEEWEIQDFKVNPASKMNFNETITSKEVTEQIYKLGQGKYLMLLYLSVIFFRKVGEPYEDSMIYEDSERLQLMKTLPMSYALHVSFFLSLSVSFWKNILVFSGNEQDQIPSQN